MYYMRRDSDTSKAATFTAAGRSLGVWELDEDAGVVPLPSPVRASACCERLINQDSWATDGNRNDGDTWRCHECHKLYAHYCDEAEGCGWDLVEPEAKKPPTRTKAGKMVPCPRCSGVGFVQKRGPLRFGEKMNIRCRRCHGNRVVREES